MYSVYFSGAQAGVSSRRSACLRSSNRSVRKSFPSQVNKSNAKKHGGFPRRNSKFLNCGLPRLSREQISPSMTALTFGRQSEIDSANAEKEANVETRRPWRSHRLCQACRAEHWWRSSLSVAGPFLRSPGGHSVRACQWSLGLLRSREC